MNQHVPSDLLDAFVEGEVSEQIASHIAEHLDDCVSCAAQAAALDPLSSAFAMVHDPIPPDELVPAVLAAVARPERQPLAEVAVGAALLLAAVLVVMAGDPIAWIVQLGTLANLTGSAANALSISISSSGMATFATLSLAVFCLLTVFRLTSNERSLAPTW